MEDKDSIIQETKANIAIEVMKLADSMYEKNDLLNKTAAVLLYFNLAEWFLVFIVRQIPLAIEEAFIRAPLGTKISKLKSVSFDYKEELLNILGDFNIQRIDVVHYMIETIYDRKMDNSINMVKKLFDEFKKCLMLILSRYGIRS